MRAALLLIMMQMPSAFAVNTQVIYGDDGRLDYYQIPSEQVKRAADATAVLILATRLSDQGATTLIQTSTYGQSLGLCPTEPFYEQERAGFCSAFLVSPDTMLTAGHCIHTQDDCNNARFVFGFKIDRAGAQPRSVPTNDVYKCARVVHTEVALADPFGADFAVVKLTRPVEGVRPLPYRQSG